MSKYEKWNKKIIVESKYGKCKINPHNMINDFTRPNLRNAINKHEYFINMLKEKNPKALELEFMDEYKTYFGEIKVKDKYGIMRTNASGLLNGNTPRINTAIDKSEYISNQFKEIHGDLYDYSKVEYKHHRKEVIIICSKHGEFLQTPRNHLNGHGCQKCKNSKGENIVKNFLIDNNIKYIPQYTIKECRNINVLRFDFVICKDDDLVICEYDGKQHFHLENCFSEEEFKNCQIRDNIKNKFCKDNNIKLIRIPYWEFDNIEDILKEELKDLIKKER